MTGYGMPPDFFTIPSKAQFNASASQPMTPQPDPSATQPMGSQQDASAIQPNAHGAWSPQMAAQVNASASPLMTVGTYQRHHRESSDDARRRQFWGGSIS